jgi:hypothetical protein
MGTGLKIIVVPFLINKPIIQILLLLNLKKLITNNNKSSFNKILIIKNVSHTYHKGSSYTSSNNKNII